MIDTFEKRMNAAGHRLPVGATDEQARIASGNAYGGNALTPGPDAATLAVTLSIGVFEPASSAGYFEPQSEPGIFEPPTPGVRF